MSTDFEKIAREIVEGAKATESHEVYDQLILEVETALGEAYKLGQASRVQLPSFDEFETANAEVNGDLMMLYEWLTNSTER